MDGRNGIDRTVIRIEALKAKNENHSTQKIPHRLLDTQGVAEGRGGTYPHVDNCGGTASLDMYMYLVGLSISPAPEAG